MTISMIVIMSDVYKSRWVLFGLLASSTIYNHNHLCLYKLCHGSHRDIMCLYMMLVSTILCGGEKHGIHGILMFLLREREIDPQEKSGIQLGFEPKNPS